MMDTEIPRDVERDVPRDVERSTDRRANGDIPFPDPAVVKATPRETLFERELPGGGQVRIELIDESAADVAGGRCVARLAVERRGDVSRRDGHIPPVILMAERGTREEVIGELFKVAVDNVAIARGLLQADRRARRGANIAAAPRAADTPAHGEGDNSSPAA